MAKLKHEKININDINDYLDNYSDFSFEISVLEKLTSAGFICEHSGTYSDPITNKTREFDIRAFKEELLSENITFRFCLAVECKNIQENCPLIIHCMKRTEQEAYNDLILSLYDEMSFGELRWSQRIKLEGDKTFYQQGIFVGKSCDQVGRFASNHKITGYDADVFDKISQAVNSTYDLFQYNHKIGQKNHTFISFVLPILVVPNDRIWTIGYDRNGSILEGPKTQKKLSYYIAKKWIAGAGTSHEKYWVSHLEITEIDSLLNLLYDHQSQDRFSFTNIKNTIANTERRLLS